MAFKTKRLLKKIVSWSGLFFFVVAAYMIYHQLSKYKLEDIKDALVSIPAHNLFLACMASLGGYVALSSYDFLALRYIGRKLAPWKWIFAGFIDKRSLKSCRFLIILRIEQHISFSKQFFRPVHIQDRPGIHTGRSLERNP